MDAKKARRCTDQLLNSLEKGITTGKHDTIEADLEQLIENFKIVTEVELAGGQSCFPEIVKHYVAVPEEAIQRNTVQAVAQGITTLATIENATPKHSEVLTMFLRLVHDHVLPIQESSDFLEYVFSAMLRVTESTAEGFANIMISTVPLSALKVPNIDSLTPLVLNNLVGVVDNLCEKRPSLVEVGEVLELFGYILEHGRVQCKAASRICERVIRFVNVQFPLPLPLLVAEKSTLVSGLMSHCGVSGLDCTSLCLGEVASLIGVLISEDEETNKLLVRQGALQMTTLATTILPHRDHKLPGAFSAVTRCLPRSPSLVEGVQNHQLLKTSIPLLAHSDSGVRDGAAGLVEQFLEVAKCHQIVRAIMLGLLDDIARLFDHGEPAVQRTGLRLLETIWQRSVRNKEEPVKQAMRTSEIHLSLLPLLDSSNVGIRQSASVLNSHLQTKPDGTQSQGSAL